MSSAHDYVIAGGGAAGCALAARLASDPTSRVLLVEAGGRGRPQGGGGARGEPMICEEVDTLVTAMGHQSEDTLFLELEDWKGEVHRIGDCLAPRTAEEAVLEGLKAGAAI